jgi:hypothetical protein
LNREEVLRKDRLIIEERKDKLEVKKLRSFELLVNCVTFSESGCIAAYVSGLSFFNPN